MNLGLVDWSMMIAAVLALRFVSFSTRRYMKGVSDFLSANRVAGRYLLTIAQQMGGIGVVAFIGYWESGYLRGLAPGWWTGFQIPVGTIILLTGWVFYRFRETRAMTMAQFLEMRYSRKFRVSLEFVLVKRYNQLRHLPGCCSQILHLLLRHS